MISVGSVCSRWCLCSEVLWLLWINCSVCVRNLILWMLLGLCLMLLNILWCVILVVIVVFILCRLLSVVKLR